MHSGGGLPNETPPQMGVNHDSNKTYTTSVSSLHEPKFACSCFQSTVDIKRLVNLSLAGPGQGQGHGQPLPPGQGLPEKNGLPGRIHHLPDLIQQSHHSPSSSTAIPPSTPSSFPSSSSYASPVMSPLNPLDKFTAIEVCCPHATRTSEEWMVVECTGVGT